MTIAIDYPRTLPRGIMAEISTKMAAVAEDLVLFDIGGVQLRLDYGVMFDELGRLSGTPAAEAKAMYVASGVENDFMRGNIETPEYLDKVRGMFGLDISSDDLIRILSLSWRGEASEVLKVKDHVMDAGYLAANFSNISELAHDVIGKKYPWIFESDEKSHPGIYSYEAGGIKPEPAMYNAVEELGFDNVVLVDDNEAYVKAGAEIGWNGILFTPYVDKSEAVRTAQQYMSSSANIEVANSPAQLVFALKRFGIEM